MHITDRRFRKLRVRVENICNSSIGHEMLVHRHFQILKLAIRAEDFAQVRFLDVLGEFLDDDFGAPWDDGCG